MTLPVKLSAVAEEMDVPDDEWTVYLHRKTGKIVTITAEDLHLLDDESGAAVVLEGLEGLGALTLEALESDEYVLLPDKFAIHEWSIMQDFARSLPDEDHCEKLERAINRRGAFAGFRDAVFELDLRDAWFSFREVAFEQIAADCLEDNNIPFERDTKQ